MNKNAENPKIMTHMVAFYPSREESILIAESLIKNGADILEVQFPFSDPTADGKYIEMACVSAIKNGFTIEEGFKIVEEISSKYKVDIFIMSYANLAYFYGIKNWVSKARECGATGLIIPDLPFDYDEGLYTAGKSSGIEIIPVITPDIPDERLQRVFEIKPEYIYTTLRRGITGSFTDIDTHTTKFLEMLNNNGGIKVLAGFGIYSKSQIQAISSYVYAAVIGSAFIKSIMDNSSVPPHIAVGEKLKELLQ